MGILERKERERIEMRRLIVEKALEIYIRDGYDKLSLRAIAAEIEYSAATIYLYFKDKNELFCDMHSMAFEGLFQKFTDLLRIKNPLERIYQMGLAYLDYAFDNPELYDLMFILNEPMLADETKDEWQCGLQVHAMLRSTIIEALEQKLVVEEHPDMLTFAVWTQMHGMISLALRNRLKPYEGFDHKLNPKPLILDGMNMMMRHLTL
jgi:AcrR family transcriptional regulator